MILMRQHLARPIHSLLRPRSPLLPQQLRTISSDWQRLVMESQAGEEGKSFPKKPNRGGKRPFNNNDNNNRGPKGGARDWQANRAVKKLKAKPKPNKEGSAEEVLAFDIEALLEAVKLDDDKSLPESAAVDGAATEQEQEQEQLPEPGTEIDIEILKLSSTGDGIGRQPGFQQLYVVPFSIPGDTVKAKVYRHLPKDKYSVADYLAVVKPSPLRDDSRVNCKYFTKCSGCQFQQMAYEDQLAHKHSIIVRAFQNFSNLPPERVPPIQDTFGSPLQYNYRTKLTPHFEAPPGAFFRRKKPETKIFYTSVPAIGFNEKSTRITIDIEDCPIGTGAVRKGMARERARMKEEYMKYSCGASILLRESTQRIGKPKSELERESPELAKAPPPDAVVVDTPEYRDVKTCISDYNALSTEYIDDFVFETPAGSFFQNNNSILSPFTDYIRQHILPPTPTPTPTANGTETDSVATPQKPIKYLIDAYSGSGLFTITLSRLFSGGSIGIDIDQKSILTARDNALLNGLPEKQCRFIAADAAKLFDEVSAFDPDETAVVLDPPRRGCDGSFLRQLLKFAPRRILYVSCNVHSQARDVGILVRGEVTGMGDDQLQTGNEKKDDWDAPCAAEKKNIKARYEIESIRGFDFFPQTGHVEGVAVLNRVDDN